jgi:hypothetical protein
MLCILFLILAIEKAGVVVEVLWSEAGLCFGGAALYLFEVLHLSEPKHEAS